MGMDLAWALVNVLCLVVTALLAASPGPAIPAHLAPIDEAVLGEFEAPEVERRLRERLARQKGLRLVEEPEPGGVRLRVTGCHRVRQSKGTVEARHDPYRVPTRMSGGGFGEASGIDSMYGVSAENKDWVLLSVLVIWEDERRELVSGDRDLSLQEAVSTVVRDLEKLARKKARRRGP